MVTEQVSVAVSNHVRVKRARLATELRGTKKIYLDTNFWIWLRDARLGTPANAHDIELLETLERLVAQRKAICPISAATFIEVFKQSMPTLQTTVTLIDDLSLGLSIIETRERLQTEVFHLIREKTKGAENVLSIHDLVWTKLSYTLGFVTPHYPSLSPIDNETIQKAFIDQMWTASLIDMLDILGEKDSGSFSAYPDNIAEQLNDGKMAHTHEYSSFKQLFLNELAGLLDLHKSMFADLMQYIYELDTGHSFDAMAEVRDDAGRLIANLIYHAFRLNKIKLEVPSFRIYCGLHAAMRWDLSRKFKPNDLYDIHHAVAALPYCDFFFTERSLRSLVNNQNLEFASIFKCQTFSTTREALDAISRNSL